MTKIYNSPHFYNADYHFEGELWTGIYSSPYYKVSNLGRIKSSHYKKGRILKDAPNRDKYRQVVVVINGSPLSRRIHRLVAIHFIKNPDNKPEVNHIDGDKLNNQADNLEWMTHAENLSHAAKSGLMQKGVERPGSKLNAAKVVNIRHMVYDGAYLSDVADLFSVHKTTIGDIIHKRKWKHVK